MTQESIEKDICCPGFDPIPWNEKLFELKDKKFTHGTPSAPNVLENTAKTMRWL